MSRQHRRWRPAFFDLLFVAALAVAFVPTFEATRSLEWPHDPDLFRDVAQAQTIRDGNLMADAHYRGETTWYNPLVPGLVALLSWSSGLSIIDLYTRAGPFVNLATPIGFYLMGSVLFGRRVAWTASLFFLFLGPFREPDWAWATYSPWLFSANLSPAFFFGALVVALRARDAPGFGWRVASGAMLGLTFLAHTAPAVVLGSLLLLDAIWRWRRSEHHPGPIRSGSTALRDLGVVLTAAFLVAQPFALSILWNYGLQLENAAGTRWAYVGLSALPGHAWAHWLLAPVFPFAVLGVGIAWRRRRSVEGTALLAWTSVAAAWIAYDFGVQAARHGGLELPVVVPGFHFMRSLHAAGAMFAGLGTVAVIDGAWSRLSTRRFVTPEGATVLVGVLLCTVAFPRYLERRDFVRPPLEARGFADPRPTVDWIRSHTAPDDVFLAPDKLDLYVVGLAGRKVSAVTWNVFSNPYVAWEPRFRNETDMMDALKTGDDERLLALAGEYGVTHVILRRGTRVDAALRDRLEVRWVGPDAVILRIRRPAVG